MNVSIEHFDRYILEKRLLFWKTKKAIPGYWVKLLIELGDDERAVMEKPEIGGHTIFSEPNPAYASFLRIMNSYTDPNDKMRPHPDEAPPARSSFTIRQFCNPKGFWKRFDTLGEAKNWAHDLRTYVQEIKEILDYNSTSPVGKETFTL